MLRIIVPLLLLAACASLDAPPKSIEEIRALIVSGVDEETRAVFASSEAAAEERVDTSQSVMGTASSLDDEGAWRVSRQTFKTWVRAEKHLDGEIVVTIETYSGRILMGAQLDTKPPSKGALSRVWVGDPWRQVSREVVGVSRECKGSRINCTEIVRRRISLSEDDVRSFVAKPDGKNIRVGSSRPIVEFLVPYNELEAVLDALGVTERFR